MKKSARTENITTTACVRELVYVLRVAATPGPPCGFATSVKKRVALVGLCCQLQGYFVTKSEEKLLKF